MHPELKSGWGRALALGLAFFPTTRALAETQGQSAPPASASTVAKMEPSSRFRIVPNDTIVLFVDLQAGITDLPLTVPLPRLGKAVHALARLARLYDMPVIVSAVAGPDGKPARILPDIANGYGEVRVHQRTTADSFLNDEIRAAIKATGRRTVLISGVSTEVAVQLPALTGLELGYRTFVVVDACGGMTEQTESAALQRVAQAGGTTVSVMTLAGEMAGDFRNPKSAEAISILYEMAGSR